MKIYNSLKRKINKKNKLNDDSVLRSANFMNYQNFTDNNSLQSKILAGKLSSYGSDVKNSSEYAF